MTEQPIQPDLAASRKEERKLVTRMLDGDESAFDKFAEEFIPRLYRYALAKLADPELAGDVTQSTLCKAVSKLDTFRGDSALLTWLCACCRNEIAMHFRKERRRPVSTDSELESDALPEENGLWAVGQSRGAEGKLLRVERARLVHHALDLLPEKYANALEWKYLQGVPVAVVGERLGVGPKAAESLLTRARNAFRKAYSSLTVNPQPSIPSRESVWPGL